MNAPQSAAAATVTAARPAADLRARVASYQDELIELRRDLHRHPELGRQEFRTTRLLRERLVAAGLEPRVLPGGTGLLVDLVPPGTAPGTPLLAFRADIDALPVDDAKQDVPYRSTLPGRAHACGHDVHTAVVLGTGLVLAQAMEAGELARPVRLIFQPAEEMMPGGALDVIAAGGMEGVGRIFAVHCDPKVPVGRIALKTGAITSACDKVRIAVDGPGGHTARPHLTTDLVSVVAKLAAELPAGLSRLMDPRWGVSLVWGRIAAGSAPNVIPLHAELEGTVRCLDLAGWREAPEVLEDLVAHLAETYRAKWTLDYHRGVPPVVNEAASIDQLETAMNARFAEGRGPVVEPTEQSLGGEDFSWYLEHAPGALARLGVRGPHEKGARDLHQGDFDADERAIAVGVELFAALALEHARI
ncbi:amidohydrolase [Kitasatospora setae]|uniref:Putative peptidase M20D family protein n=1 Tax=Kitasatospora setae (strain ATCC 33774 / DSM 43861 / JCM 3304 / KCC A-0304 / NBRC 14216 / KM-6054) TaxID=452652 RepID=E4NCB3_KITSK|nr:putative peptidase M20D family protein [Kitasatospora setae KM-6054]